MTTLQIPICGYQMHRLIKRIKIIYKWWNELETLVDCGLAATFLGQEQQKPQSVTVVVFIRHILYFVIHAACGIEAYTISD